MGNYMKPFSLCFRKGTAKKLSRVTNLLTRQRQTNEDTFVAALQGKVENLLLSLRSFAGNVRNE